jgi:hypothetical protein
MPLFGPPGQRHWVPCGVHISRSLDHDLLLCVIASSRPWPHPLPQPTRSLTKPTVFRVVRTSALIGRAVTWKHGAGGDAVSQSAPRLRRQGLDPPDSRIKSPLPSHAKTRRSVSLCSTIWP